MRSFKKVIIITSPVFIIWISCFLMMSCTKTVKENHITDKENPTSSSAQYHINIDIEKDSVVRSSTIFRKSSYLLLESKEGALIGNIDKLIFDKGRIFIVDKDRAQAVFIFDKEGRLIERFDDSTIVTFAHAHQVLASKKAYIAHLKDAGTEHNVFPELTENDNTVLFFYNIFEF